MTIQKGDKNKMIINMVVLIVVFSIAGYFILPNLFGSDSIDIGLGLNVSNNEAVIQKKYKNLRRIDLSVFKDERYIDLKKPKRGLRQDVKKGNTKPFYEVEIIEEE